MYGNYRKANVFVYKPLKVTENNKDTSLLYNLTIFCTLRVRNASLYRPTIKPIKFVTYSKKP